MSELSRKCVFRGVHFTQCDPLTTHDLVSQFEKNLGFKLPLDYRQFLFEVNGGAIESPSYIALPNIDVVMVHVLMGLNRERGFRIEFGIDEAEFELPKQSIVIGRDPGGNLFLLDQSPSLEGIFFVDMRGKMSPIAEVGTIYFIAENFTEFLLRLRPSLDEAEADVQRFAIPERVLAESDGNEPDRPPSPEDDLKKLLEQESLFEKRLILVGQHFINKLDFESPLDTAIAGFSLSLPLSAWDRKRHDKLIESRVGKANTDPVLLDVIQNDPKTLQLFLLLFGYVMGQYHADKLSDRQYVYSQDTIVSAMRTVIPK